MSDSRSVALQSNKKSNRILSYLTKPILAAVTISLVDTLFLQFGFGFISRNTLTLVLLLEGGMGLLSGVGIALSSTPSISRIGHATIGTAAWSRDAEKNAARVGLKWMAAASLLAVLGFTLSIV
jgi:hypothetical protein